MIVKLVRGKVRLSCFFGKAVCDIRDLGDKVNEAKVRIKNY
jgi:hypothetical protein